MTCFMCKGSIEDRQTSFLVDVENCIVIIKNVPSQVCKQCGERSHSDSVAAELERIVSEARKTITEVTIINYESWVA